MKGFKKKELLNGNLIGKSQHDRTDTWMAQYLALSGLVGAYLALGNKGSKS